MTYLWRGCPLLLVDDRLGLSFAMASVQSWCEGLQLKGMAKYLHCSNSSASRAVSAKETFNAFSQTTSISQDLCSTCPSVENCVDIGSSLSYLLPTPFHP